MMVAYNSEYSMVDTFDKIDYLEYFKDGQSKKIKADSEEFAKITAKLKSIFSDAHLMPAFGVSIHDLTINEMKQGEWLKLHYNKELEKNGLPFTSLLFKLEDTYGINLIREYQNRYDGRCIYLDFTKQINLKDLI